MKNSLIHFAKGGLMLMGLIAFLYGNKYGNGPEDNAPAEFEKEVIELALEKKKTP